MKILVISDVEEKALYDHFNKKRVEGVDLIISCGDLDVGYLDFLMTMVNVPMVYVLGNHDDKLVAEPPLGGISLEGRIVNFKGYKIAGLGGCLRYNNRCINMYTESEMFWHCIKLAIKAKLKGGIDLFITHAPAKGYGDLEDRPHMGYECFNSLLSWFKPKYMFHGHVHTNYHRYIQKEYYHPSGTTIMNCCGYKIIDLPDKE